MNPPHFAYVDESMRVSSGLYLMAAVLVPPTCAEGYRAVLRGLLLRNQRRLHWRDEKDKRRVQLVEAIGALRPCGIVVIGTGLDRGRQERARRKCMERLLWELSNRDIGEVVFESRGPQLDASDRKMIDIMRIRSMLPDRIRAAWRNPIADPLVWMPDIVAGAASLAEIGEESLVKALGRGVLIERISID
ncbi:hypothetical protein PS9374_01665 [Planomonospora sphaerica]|uniref:DUF3800 domain-containing protein n=1 Tax=Planomonospora sphaerica TaxID=161355 RepID=A0A161LVQ5_9ACTN|nr:hypothetical protein [Planomonospora sphaerica]GAT66021.1 hypothetical protein PS9374_01665 [Planomonospora sphaerica]